jgi:hypothetical protein
VNAQAPVYEFRPGLILGFHGCDRDVGEAVLSGQTRHLKASEKDFDWLGSGIYFWEGSHARAWEWARERQRMGKIKNPFVLGAVIDLRHCLDLFDSGFRNEVKRAYHVLRTTLSQNGQELPRNAGPTPDYAARWLDCAVMNLLLARREKNAVAESGMEPFDSVRGPFLEGEPIYPGAGFRSQTHIQISVRNTDCIKGYFRPLAQGGVA